jgi:hypothetical protein
MRLDARRRIFVCAFMRFSSGQEPRAKGPVGLQYTDPGLISHLQDNRIPFVRFDGAEFYPDASAGAHWTPEGHKLVAERVLGLLAENNIAEAELSTPR